MRSQMGFHLPFGFDHKTEAGGRTEPACKHADAEGAGIPERIEHAGVRTKFVQALFAPGEVIAFL